MNLSTNFTLVEMTRSWIAAREGINNTPTPIQIEALRYLCQNTLQPARDALGFPVTNTSGFRSKALNTRVGGSSTSHHKATMGRVAASDLVCRDNARLFHTLRTQGNFDQLIWEFGDSNQPAWVHVSTRVLDQRPNRRLIFVAYKDRNNKTRYKRWTP